MTQHVTIISTDKVEPFLARVWRDDQTLMWGLTGNLAWPPDEPQPIQFLPGGGEFANWPGTVPTPVGPAPAVGPDQRFYVALAQKIMPNGETEKYHYAINVINTTTGERVRVRGYDSRTGEWYDPDVENQPQP